MKSKHQSNSYLAIVLLSNGRWPSTYALYERIYRMLWSERAGQKQGKQSSQK